MVEDSRYYVNLRMSLKERVKVNGVAKHGLTIPVSVHSSMSLVEA